MILQNVLSTNFTMLCVCGVRAPLYCSFSSFELLCSIVCGGYVEHDMQHL